MAFRIQWGVNWLGCCMKHLSSLLFREHIAALVVKIRGTIQAQDKYVSNAIWIRRRHAIHFRSIKGAISCLRWNYHHGLPYLLWATLNSCKATIRLPLIIIVIAQISPDHDVSVKWIARELDDSCFFLLMSVDTEANRGDSESGSQV